MTRADLIDQTIERIEAARLRHAIEHGGNCPSEILAHAIAPLFDEWGDQRENETRAEYADGEPRPDDAWKRGRE